jgi:hypothetical protein
MPRAQGAARKRTIEPYDSYLFEIERVNSHYSFGDGHHLQRTAFSEYLHPEITASCLKPDKFRSRRTRFMLLGDRSAERDLWMQATAPEHHSGVGTLTFRGDRSDYLGSVPFDALWNVLHSAHAGGFRFIYLHGAAVRHGSARIRSIGFYDEFDPDEL